MSGLERLSFLMLEKKLRITVQSSAWTVLGLWESYKVLKMSSLVMVQAGKCLFR